MGRIRTSYSRATKTKEVVKKYVIAFEGKRTEPRYFKSLCRDYFSELNHAPFLSEDTSIEVILVEEEGKHDSHPEQVLNRLLAEKAEQDKNHMSQYAKRDEYWMLIDLDHWVDNQGVDMQDLAVRCESNENFHFALSNPCIELWLLLHFLDVSLLSEENKSAIKDNPKVSTKKNLISNVLAIAKTGQIEGLAEEEIVKNIDDYCRTLEYKGRGEGKKIKGSQYVPFVQKAIKGAEKLNPEDGNLLQNLGTRVYELVRKLTEK